MVHFYRGKKGMLPRLLKIKDKQLTLAKETKYLGLILDDKLTWQAHTKHKIKECKSFLYSTRHVLSKKWGPSMIDTRWMWTSMVRPQITYSSVICGNNLTNTSIQKLRSLQWLAMSLLAHTRKSTPMATMEVLFQIPPLHLEIQRLAMETMPRVMQNRDWNRESLVNARGHINQGAKHFGRVNPKEPLDSRVPFNHWPTYKAQIDTGDNVNINSADWCCFTDGSVINNKAGAGVAIYQKGHHIATISVGLGQMTIFQAELKAI